jgi:hypothetical protein
MTEKRKPTYEQALALERGQAAARRAAKQRATMRVERPQLTDEQRREGHRQRSTEELQWRLSLPCPEDSRRLMAEVLAEREDQ